jgi:hypothetical protein
MLQHAPELTPFYSWILFLLNKIDFWYHYMHLQIAIPIILRQPYKVHTLSVSILQDEAQKGQI